MRFLIFLMGFLLLVYLIYEGIRGNIVNTEPGAIAGFLYYLAGIVHYKVTVNLVMVFYLCAILLAVLLIFIGMAGGKPER